MNLTQATVRAIVWTMLALCVSLLTAPLVAALAQPASAPAGDQPCGQGGTALRVGQGSVTLTDAQALAPDGRTLELVCRPGRRWGR